MSQIGLGMGEPDPEHHEHDFIEPEEPRRGRRSSRRRRRRGCLPVLLVLVVVAGGLAIGGKIAYDEISARLAPAPDYAGPGTGEVLYEVKDGATSAHIGRDLKEAGVVKSVDAFTAAARENQESRNIQVGFYTLQKQMKAAEALEVLVDPANRVRNQVTVPEGLRAVDVAKLLGEKTDFPRAQFTRELENPTALGLPDYAEGNPEGYMFPATYEIGPKDNPRTILRAMVERWRQAAEDADLEARAEELGFTPAEVMTIASLVEAEGRGDDMAKISRVLYNRLETKGPPTFGKLEVDATVNYALGRNLGVAISPEDLEVDSPYNTRKNAGLPPGPIEAPGEEAIRAALEPAEGDWLFYVTVNLRTGETKFAKDYDEFLRYKKEYQQYCETSDAC